MENLKKIFLPLLLLGAVASGCAEVPPTAQCTAEETKALRKTARADVLMVVGEYIAIFEGRDISTGQGMSLDCHFEEEAGGCDVHYLCSFSD